MTSVGAATSRQPVEQRLHRALPGPAQAGGEPGGPVAQARRRGGERPWLGGSAAWLANTGSRSQASTKASIPSRSSAIGACLVGGAPVAPLGGRRQAGGRALEHEPADAAADASIASRRAIRAPSE